MYHMGDFIIVKKGFHNAFLSQHEEYPFNMIKRIAIATFYSMSIYYQNYVPYAKYVHLFLKEELKLPFVQNELIWTPLLRFLYAHTK